MIERKIQTEDRFVISRYALHIGISYLRNINHNQMDDMDNSNIYAYMGSIMISSIFIIVLILILFK